MRARQSTLIDEFGIGLVVTITIAGVLAWIIFGEKSPLRLASSDLNPSEAQI
jgi:hypothetical protein